MKYLPFADAREFVHNLALESRSQWREYCNTGRKPSDIPSSPSTYYENEWKDWGDWLGTGTLSPKNKKFLPFDEAKKLVQALNLRSIAQWNDYCKSGRKQAGLPTNPSSSYKEFGKVGVTGLVPGRVANQNRVYRNFEDARRFVQLLGIKTSRQWVQYSKSYNKPPDIPSGPDDVYKTDWKGWGDWLGTDYVASYKRNYRSFVNARRFAQTLGLQSEKDWKRYCTSAEKPEDIPNSPAHVYKKDWKSIGDWLGTGYVALYNRTYRNFEDARRFVHSLGLGIRNKEQWQEYCRTGKKPNDVPNKPNHVYKIDWKGWGDWLGTGYIANQNRVYRDFEDARRFVQLWDYKDVKNGMSTSFQEKNQEIFPEPPGIFTKKSGLEYLIG